MEYVTIRRFKRKGMGGEDLNIPYGAVLQLHDDGNIYYGDRAVCVKRSAAAHEYFACNYDGKGFERGRLSHDIVKALRSDNFDTKEEYFEAWEPIWADNLAAKYRRKEHIDTWLWSDDFYNAPIEDLKYIAGIAGVKGV